MNLFYIERKVDGEWKDVCHPTKDESLARKICHMDADKHNATVRVATYDDREEDAHVVYLMSVNDWGGPW